mgnify:CR=1 FL=1
MVKWLFGIPYEIAFWDAGFRNAQTRKSLFAFSHYGQSIQLTGFDVEKFLLQQTNPTEVKILDVGCGMTYYPGDKLYVDGEEKQINIHYITPVYNLLLIYNLEILQFDRRPSVVCRLLSVDDNKLKNS